MINKVLHFIKEKQLLEEDKHVLVGVSGGPDSMALLHILHTLKQQLHIKVSAVTIDHQLREEAKCDVQYVKRYCDTLGIPFKAVTVDVKAYKNLHNVSTQVAARNVRYAIYEKTMKEVGAHYVALGHHGDDQIETAIMSLMRSTNLTSFNGIPLKRTFAAGFIIRPLLCVTKDDIERYCKDHHIEPQYDSSNEETTYTRNAIRKYVVPTLKDYNANLHVTVQRLVESLREDELYLFHEAEKIFTSLVSVQKEKRRISFIANELQCIQKPFKRRIFQRIMLELYRTVPKTLTYKHEESFFRLLHSERNGQLHFPSALIVERVYDEIHCYFQTEQTKERKFHETIHDLPANIHLPNGAKLVLDELPKDVLPNKVNHDTFIIQKRQVTFPLHVRTRQSGDRMRYKGLKGTKKIKDILIDEKIPRQERENIYLLTDDEGTILWLIGLRKADSTDTCRTDRYIVCTYKNSN